jgi:hypothetical protein
VQIPPVSSTGYFSDFPKDPKDRLDELLKEYRAALQDWLDNPSDKTLKSLEAVMNQIRRFLEHHKKEIYDIAKKNGWPTDDPSSEYENYFQNILDAIENFKQNPNAGSASFANECLTQLLWLLNNHR